MLKVIEQFSVALDYLGCTIDMIYILEDNSILFCSRSNLNGNVSRYIFTFEEFNDEFNINVNEYINIIQPVEFDDDLPDLVADDGPKYVTDYKVSNQITGKQREFLGLLRHSLGVFKDNTIVMSKDVYDFVSFIECNLPQLLKDVE